MQRAAAKQRRWHCTSSMRLDPMPDRVVEGSCGENGSVGVVRAARQAGGAPLDGVDFFPVVPQVMQTSLLAGLPNLGCSIIRA